MYLFEIFLGGLQGDEKIPKG